MKTMGKDTGNGDDEREVSMVPLSATTARIRAADGRGGDEDGDSADKAH